MIILNWIMKNLCILVILYILHPLAVIIQFMICSSVFRRNPFAPSDRRTGSPPMPQWNAPLGVPVNHTVCFFFGLFATNSKWFARLVIVWTKFIELTTSKTRSDRLLFLHNRDLTLFFLDIYYLQEAVSESINASVGPQGPLTLALADCVLGMS